MYLHGYNQHFHIAGEDCCNRSARNAQGRCAELPVNQDIIEAQVHNDCRNSRFHRQDRLPAFPQRAGISLHNGEGRQPRQHNP